MTYDLHILARFELERALVSGDLRPAELPAAWDEAYRRLLGVAPADDAEGCLQDGHWAAGMLGYFPTIPRQCDRGPAVRTGRGRDGRTGLAFARGDFSPLRAGCAKVYRHGGRYPAARLVERATGVGPDSRLLVASLRRKYGELYGVDLSEPEA